MWMRAAIVGVSTVMFMSSSFAEDLDFSKVTCKEFISAPKDQIATVLTWLEGFYTKENDPPILYADKTMKDAKNLSAYCNAHGEDSIVKAADAVMPAK